MGLPVSLVEEDLLLSVIAYGDAGGVGGWQSEDPRAGPPLDHHLNCTPPPLPPHCIFSPAPSGLYD